MKEVTIPSADRGDTLTVILGDPVVPRERSNGTARGMQAEHEAHLSRINAIFHLVNSAKYRRGQNEHGGNLWEVPLEELLINSLFEQIDCINYTLSALEQRGIAGEDVISALHNGFRPVAG